MTLLTRRSWPAGDPWPLRQVHLGPGAFSRSHTAWCNAAAGDGWGVAAVGRPGSASAAALAAQDGLYSLVTREPGGDAVEVLGPVVAAADLASLGDLLSAPQVGVVTATLSEAGYRRGSPVLAALAAALHARLARMGRQAPVAVVCCDNVASGGPLLRSLVLDADPRLAAWVEAGACTFVSSVVDRITPAATDADRAAVAGRLGFEDRAAVVAESAFEWVVADDFPAGRPAWEKGGALLVDDVTPWAERKLRLLNAGHSLLAYAGGAAGHRFVHEAVADPALVEVLECLWDEATAGLPGDTARLCDDAYRASLLERWSNPRMGHLLSQIASNGAAKLVGRVVPTLRSDVGSRPASVAVLGAWVAHLRGATAFPPVDDRWADLAAVAAARSLDEAAGVALSVLDSLVPGAQPHGPLAGRRGLRTAVAEAARRHAGALARRQASR